MKKFKKHFISLLVFCLLVISGKSMDLGIDTLSKSHFDLLQGKRIALVTDKTGVNKSGKPTRLILKKNANLVVLFTTENGLESKDILARHGTPYFDRETRVITYPLIGKKNKPTAAMLAGVDVLVYDVQNIGCRNDRALSTLMSCMRAAANEHKEVMILDRPNPLSGSRVEGMTLNLAQASQLNELPIPYVYGMTVGELALMANRKGWLGRQAPLTVIPMAGWSRSKTWPQTGLRWVARAPYLSQAMSCFYYVITGAIAELQQSVRVGIGTSQAYQILTAPWVDKEMLAYLRDRCQGIKISLTTQADHQKGIRFKINPKRRDNNLCFASVALLYENYWYSKGMLFQAASSSELNQFFAAYGSSAICQQLKASPEHISSHWEPALSNFRAARRSYLIYH